MNLRPGTQVGPYRITQEIARGGQGAVLEALDPAGRAVALKLLLDDDEESAARFLREGETLSRLDHPNLIKVLDQGQTSGGVAYLALEFVRGQSLAEWVRSGGPPPLDEALRVMADAAEALDYCHEQGLVHRDLKPQNILLEAETGRVVVVDFGLVRRSKLALAWSTQDRASLTQEGAVLGTPAYMPPEQISPEFGGVDRRSDVYGLGATLFFLLTGEAPFKAPGGLLQLLTRVASDPPADPRTLRPDLPDHLAELSLRSLAKDPAQRPSTALEFGAALLGPRGRKGGVLVGALALAGLVVTGLAVGGAALALSPPRPRPAPSVVAASPEASRPPLTPQPSLTPANDVREEVLALAKLELAGDDEDKRREAEALLYELIEQGSARAAFILGTHRTEDSPAEAFKLLGQAAEGESHGAMVNLGLLYQKGRGAPKDLAQARHWFQRAAEGGQPLGMLYLGRQLLNGKGGPRDAAEGVRWLREAATRDEAGALLVLGECAERGQGLTKDLAHAEELYEEALRKGHPSSALRLGLLLQAKENPRDRDRAMKLFADAARAGQQRAYFLYAEALMQRQALPRDAAEALLWFRKGAEAGHLPSQARLGALYLDGARGVRADPAQGVALLEQAAAQGDPAAMFHLGRARLNGLGTAKDVKAGLNLTKRAAEGGDKNGMLLYYALLIEGQVTPEDRAAAKEWLRKAAEAGQPQAMGFWGVELRQRKEFEAAIPWLKDGALQGDRNAMFTLASCYIRGEGVNKDLSQARKLLSEVAQGAPGSELGRRAAKALGIINKVEAKQAGRKPEGRRP